jgi:hypothetical protein
MGAPWVTNIFENYQKFENGPRGIIRGSVKIIHEKTDIKNLVTMTL